MIRMLLSLLLGFAAVAAVPRTQQRIVGGSATTINNYPSIASLLYSSDYALYQQSCGGIIINARSILTAASCPFGDVVSRWRVRVGSTYGNSGGVVHSLQSYIMHYNYYPWTRDSDIAIMRTASVITYTNAVQAGRFAGANYNLDDNQVVTTAGWGRTSYYGPTSEQLRHVQVWTINQATCVERYRSISETVTDNMLCSGWLNVGGRGQCQGDYGSPLYHNNIVVGVYSWGEECGLAGFPGVNTRVSRFTSWIQANA